MAYLVDVRAGEGVGALLFAFNLFLLLGAYYLLKTAREALILTQGGAEVKSYSAAGQAVLLLVIVPLYGAFASRVGRVRLVAGVCCSLRRTWPFSSSAAGWDFAKGSRSSCG